MLLSDVERARVAALRVMVVEGAIPPGEPRSCGDFAAVLGTDALGVADAVRELARDGFVELLSDDRFMVSPDAHDDVDDLVAIRLLVEPTAYRQAAAQARVADLITLREQARAVGEACRRVDVEDYFEATEGFFATLLAVLPNRQLADLVIDLRRRTRLDGARQVLEAGLRSDVEPWYQNLVSLIEERDLDGVARVTREFLQRIRFLGAPRKERGAAWPLVDTLPPELLPVVVDEYDDTGWSED